MIRLGICIVLAVVGIAVGLILRRKYCRCSLCDKVSLLVLWDYHSCDFGGNRE